jgi:galactosamine-6-phosphate isomerase
MHIVQCDSYQELSELSCSLLIDQLKVKPTSLICVASGGSPTGIYAELVKRKEEAPLQEASFIKLDEWYGLPMDHPGTSEYYVQKHVLKPLNISPENYISFNSQPKSAEAECQRVEDYLIKNGPIDLCILGIGMNGHIALNEPAEYLQPNAHVADLSASSLTHPMIKDAETDLKQGLTLGVGDLLKSKKIVLLVNGPHKKEIMDKFLTGMVTTQLPASLLWLHPDVHCFYSKNQ